MTDIFDADRSRPGSDEFGVSLQDDHLPPEFLSPIIAGAFARGIAETLNLLAVPALLLDRTGTVLFASTAAGSFLAQHLALEAGHLLARTEPDNDPLAAFMAELLREPQRRRTVTLAASGVTLSAMPPPHGPTSGDQLLHAIVVISPSELEPSFRRRI